MVASHCIVFEPTGDGAGFAHDVAVAYYHQRQIMMISKQRFTCGSFRSTCPWRNAEHIPKNFLLVLAVLSGGVLFAQNREPGHPAVAGEPAGDKVRSQIGSSSFANCPLSFEPNRGQDADEQARFISHSGSAVISLKATEVAFRWPVPAAGESARGSRRLRKSGRALSVDALNERPAPKWTELRMKLVGAAAAPAVAGLEELEGKVNYFIGQDSSKWRTDIPTFKKVRCANVYSGVDLVYYGDGRRLEYDFVVAPKADYKKIGLTFEGTKQIEIETGSGDLLVHTESGLLREHRPRAYQEIDGRRQEIASSYVVDRGRVGFSLESFDADKPVVIDPVFVYSTYVGDGGSNTVSSIARDTIGNIYITGSGSSDHGTAGVNIKKINAAGTALVYSTFIGDNGISYSIAVDTAGNAYITGTTNGVFPYVNIIPTGNTCGGTDAFVAKLNPAGNALVYSTCLGGDHGAVGFGIALDSSANVYVAGATSSTNFPTTTNAFQHNIGTCPTCSTMGNGFVTKINAAGTALSYSTYLGGSPRAGDINGTGNNGFGAIAVDFSGNAYLAGTTSAYNFPTTGGCIQPTKHEPTNGDVKTNATVTKLDPNGASLVYSTYLGAGYDGATGIALDSADNAYVTGAAGENNFPTVHPIQATFGGYYDVFVSKIDPTGSQLVYSTYLGSSGDDEATGIAVNAAGAAYITGYTDSQNFPRMNALQNTYGGGQYDAFLTKINPAGSSLVYSTFLGGSDEDIAYGIVVDDCGSAYTTGYTYSTNFPTNNALQGNNAGADDAFITRVYDNDAEIVSISRLPNGHVLLHGIGTPFCTHNTVQFAPDLTSPFAVIGTASGDATGAFTFEDSNSSGLRKGFYRLIAP